jgi:hypothetical protein
MPWMVCKCGSRFYAAPSKMAEARCDDCTNCDCARRLGIPKGQLCGNPTCPRTIEAEQNLKRIGEILWPS